MYEPRINYLAALIAAIAHFLLGVFSDPVRQSMDQRHKNFERRSDQNEG